MANTPPAAPPGPEPDYDPIVEARVQHAIAPYVGLLPPADLEALALLTRQLLTTHPVVAPMVDRLRERVPKGESDERPRKDPAALAAAAERLARKTPKGSR